jgi:hypothetical protein
MFLQWWLGMGNTNTTAFSQSIQQALDQQSRLGWDQFLRGRIGLKWAQLQSQHFLEQKMRQTGQKWASHLIMALWDFTWSMWDNRNHILHHSEVMDKLLDMDIIDLSIIEEWHAGADDLKPIDRMQWKGITLEELLAKRSRYRRDWLSFVQTARTAMDPLAEGEEYD